MQGVHCLYFLSQLWCEDFFMTEFFTICLEQPRRLFLLNKLCAYKRSVTCNPKMIWMEKEKIKECRTIQGCADSPPPPPFFLKVFFMSVVHNIINLMTKKRKGCGELPF